MTMSNESKVARHLVDVCHLLYDKGFVTATDGNVSARLRNGNILTTPTSINKGRVTEADLVEVTLEGEEVEAHRKPSMELGMHLFIYRQRSDVGAVVHAHPPYATGFATARMALDMNLLPEVIFGLGSIPLARYATPSTGEVAVSIAPFVHTSNAILLENHGVVTYGADLDDAFFKMEKVEHAAHVAFVARMLGGGQQLSSKEVAKLFSAFGKKES
jgi:L-fuculose-phosphate aldolase